MMTQGCSLLATLGFGPESLWDSYHRPDATKMRVRRSEDGRTPLFTMPQPLLAASLQNGEFDKVFDKVFDKGQEHA